MSQEPRLARELRTLVHAHRTAALGTIGEGSAPFVSMVPFAVQPLLGCLVIHVSDLAAHTRNLQKMPKVSLLVMRSEVHGEPVHDLPRVTLEGHAELLEPNSSAWQECRGAYLARFPEAEPMTQLGDFRFFAVHVTHGRQIAGFGVARDVDAQEIKRAFGEEIVQR